MPSWKELKRFCDRDGWELYKDTGKQMDKKITAVIAIVIIIMSSAAFLAAGGLETEENMLKNANFERGSGKNAADWNKWNNGNSGDTEALYVEGGGRDGTGCVEITNHAPIASNFNQYTNIQAGKSYKISGWIKTQGISNDGYGAGFAYAGYEANDEWFCEDFTDGLHGDSDWTYVEKIFSVPDEVARAVVAVRIWFSTGTAWFDSVELVEFDAEAVLNTSAIHRFKIADEANTHPVYGFGCEWDPKLIFYPNTNRGVGEDDIALIKRRMETLNIHRVRTMVLPHWFEPENGRFEFEGKGDADEMDSLWLYLDICEQLGIKVTLTWWGAANGTWLSYSTDALWLSAPNDLGKMANNISAFLQYARNEKKYTCIDSVILQNEPSYAFVVEGGSVDFDYYVKYYKTVYERLNADGLGDIALIGSDDAQNFDWYKKSVEHISDYVSRFNSHFYLWSAKDYDLGRTIQNYAKKHAQLTDKPFFFGEFGDGSTEGAYTSHSVDTYGRGLFVAACAINMLKGGASGALYWPLHDVYYYAGEPNDGSNGGLMKMGLFAYKDDNNWRVRPTYHAWGLVCNYVLPGSAVYNITGENEICEAVAAKTKDGKWTLLAANRSNANQTIEIDADMVGADLQFILYDIHSVTESDALIESSDTISPQGGIYTFTLPGESFAVLTNVMPESKSAAKGQGTAESEGQKNTEKSAANKTGLFLAAGIAAAAIGIAGFLFLKNKKKKSKR
jgi:hypothetical protein